MANSQHPMVELVLHTAQMGGSLVIVSEAGQTQARDFLNAAVNTLSGEVAMVLRRAEDLLTRKFETQAEDMVVFLSASGKLLLDLDPVLAGQRVLLGAECQRPSLDFVFPEVNLIQWGLILSEVAKALAAAGPVAGFAGQEEAPCLFLDRDDVIVHNVPYNKDPAQVVLMDGVVKLINAAHARGYWVGLVTNQSGLGRGWISWAEYRAVHQQMLRLLAQQGAWLDDCEWSAFIDEAGTVQGRLLAGLRKPRNGMFLKVHQKLRVRMSDSVMVGDSASDLFAAYAAGVRRLYLLKSGKSDKELRKLAEFSEHGGDFKYTFLENLAGVQL